ncbi:MarC family protein [Porphyromonadaceae bacterium OttesenSCG-928-L07]|nr:MarC family protein [Porphyromonadaceae bacterium OttesenSCG-928-L07]MDL2251455.1 MarC family protein [Odoribacter sp. OttesenSCG-928-J03]MDL2282952.1 MarC family protein [Odoribacter sp. OttesenSCG-928-G04]
MELNFSFTEIISTFMVLFAVIDITGSTPIILNLKSKGNNIYAGKAAGISFLILIAFLFAGESILRLFNIDISSFAVAGALVLFVLAIEMVLDVEVFRNDSMGGSATIVPIVFPLIVGPGTLTTAISLRAEYHLENILTAIVLNMIVVYLVLKYVHIVEKLIGKGGVYILRKFFGVILLAMAVKLFTSNLSVLLSSLN